MKGWRPSAPILLLLGDWWQHHKEAHKPAEEKAIAQK